MTIDLNADLGEGMNDADILPFVTSANVSCGIHAGDPETMESTVRQALERGVKIGAHPSYPDRENFGRKILSIGRKAIEAWVFYQISALDGFVRASGATMHHVKPHGALYNQAADDWDVARAVAAAVKRYRPDLCLVGLSGSVLVDAGREAGLLIAQEAFADRRYLSNGRLAPRSQSGAVLATPEAAAEQAVSIARDGRARTENGQSIKISADTICLHGDNPRASAFAAAIRAALERAGIAVKALPPR